MNRQLTVCRIAELNAAIAKTKQWGAALTAMEEERRGLERRLRWLANGPEPGVHEQTARKED